MCYVELGTKRVPIHYVDYFAIRSGEHHWYYIEYHALRSLLRSRQVRDLSVRQEMLKMYIMVTTITGTDYFVQHIDEWRRTCLLSEINWVQEGF